MSLLNYSIKRLLATVPILIGVMVITFILSREMPGSPFSGPEGGKITPAAIQQAKESDLGLDDPLHIQFWKYLKAIARGDWGETIANPSGIPVWEYIWTKVPLTIELGVTTVFLSTILGIRIGVFSAVNQNNIKDTVVRFVALIGVSIPVFWMGIMLKYLFAFKVDIFPTSNYVDTWAGLYLDRDYLTGFGTIDSLLAGEFKVFFNIIWHMVLPTFCLTFLYLAGLVRQTRSSMLEVMELDYVRSARAKGCKEKDVINKHALKNALIPTVTIIGVRIGFLLGGATLTETTFNLDGMGKLMVSAINNRDYFLINALVFLATFILIIANLITDVTYAILDPRIRY